jgi:hypothetical protein
MDHIKEALKRKLGKVVTIKIAVNHDENPKDSDLAPDVKDSNEVGVKTRDRQEVIPQGRPEGAYEGEGEGEGPEGSPEHEGSESPGYEMLEQKNPGEQYADALIAQAPDHPAAGKTLDSIAKERAMKRRVSQPIVDEQVKGLPFRKRKK